jgi:hypothetical protein
LTENLRMFGGNGDASTREMRGIVHDARTGLQAAADRRSDRADILTKRDRNGRDPEGKVTGVKKQTRLALALPCGRRLLLGPQTL